MASTPGDPDAPLEPAEPDLPRAFEPLLALEGDWRDEEMAMRHATGLDLAGADLTKWALTESRLDDVTLDGATLGDAAFRDVTVLGGSWANASAERILLSR